MVLGAGLAYGEEELQSGAEQVLFCIVEMKKGQKGHLQVQYKNDDYMRIDTCAFVSLET